LAVVNLKLLMSSKNQTEIPRVHRYVTNDLTMRIAAVDATEAVQEMQKIQSSMPLAAIGVGRAMVASLLMAANLKEGQDVGLLFRGNGPLGSIYAEASFEGHVRGYCPHPLYEAPNEEDILKLGKALGSGTLSVSRHQPFQRQPHHGTVNLVSGEVGDDIAHYLAQSHQIRSLVSLGVYIDTYGQVQAAGGVLIEVMPGVEDSSVETLYKNYQSINFNISKSLYEGVKVNDLITPFMKDLPFTEIPHEPKVSYFCPCTVERVIGALSILGVEELEEMIRDKEPAKVTCQICGRKYEVDVSQLEDLKESLRKNSMH
jgi:molecular chaperone Hsp33